MAKAKVIFLSMETETSHTCRHVGANIKLYYGKAINPTENIGWNVQFSKSHLSFKKQQKMFAFSHRYQTWVKLTTHMRQQKLSSIFLYILFDKFVAVAITRLFWGKYNL